MKHRSTALYDFLSPNVIPSSSSPATNASLQPVSEAAIPRLTTKFGTIWRTIVILRQLALMVGVRMADMMVSMRQQLRLLLDIYRYFTEVDYKPD